MSAIFGILAMVLALGAVVGWIWCLVVIFQKGGILWGLISVFIGLVGLIYIAMNWSAEFKRPFLLFLGSTVGMWVCGFLGGMLAGG